MKQIWPNAPRLNLKKSAGIKAKDIPPTPSQQAFACFAVIRWQKTGAGVMQIAAMTGRQRMNSKSE